MSDALNQDQKPLVRIFACGGGGTNIAHTLETKRGQAQVGFSDLDLVYIDTSKSNLRADIPSDRTYLVEGKAGPVKEGAGKNRLEKAALIEENIPAIVRKFGVADLNVVLHMLGGGTGSVAGPLLAGELLSRKAPTIVLAVGDRSTRVDIRNTRDTLKSYEGVAQAQKRPVVLSYLENGLPEHGNAGASRTDITARINTIVVMLCALYSTQHRELDATDLYNWLNFANPRLTTFEAQLAHLELLNATDPANDLGNIISVATLATDGQSAPFLPRPDVQFTGYLPAGFASNIAAHAPHHFVISDGVLPEKIAEFSALLGDIDDTTRARKSRQEILTNEDKPVAGTGLVF